MGIEVDVQGERGCRVGEEEICRCTSVIPPPRVYLSRAATVLGFDPLGDLARRAALIEEISKNVTWQFP